MSDKTTTEDPFMDIMDQVERQYTKKVDKCWRLQALLDRKEHECRDLEHQLGTAIKLLDVQKQKTRLARREKEELIDQIRDIVFKAKASADRLSAEELRQKLSFLYNNNLSGDWDASLNHHNGHLSAIKEVNSTGEDQLLEVGGRLGQRQFAEWDGVKEASAKYGGCGGAGGE